MNLNSYMVRHLSPEYRNMFKLGAGAYGFKIHHKSELFKGSVESKAWI